LEYSSVWIAGHSVGGHIASSIALDAPAPNITLSKPERDPSTLSQIIGVIGIEGIYVVDLLKNSPPTSIAVSLKMLLALARTLILKGKVQKHDCRMRTSI